MSSTAIAHTVLVTAHPIAPRLLFNTSFYFSPSFKHKNWLFTTQHA